VRTQNLWLCVGLHSLVNTPIALWALPIPKFVAPTLALFLFIILGARVLPTQQRQSSSLDPIPGN
jgi:hypothetical protein